MKRIPRLVVVAAILALIFSVALTGCGSKQSAAPSASTTTESPAANEAATPTNEEPSTTEPGSNTAPGVSPDPAPAQPAPTTVEPAPSTTSTSPAAPAPTPAKPAAAKPSVTPSTPASVPAPAPAAVSVPASLTGAKADAYKLLIGCKYSGSAESSWNATMLDVPILGDVDMKVTTNGNAVSGQGVPSTVGGDFTNRKLSAIPFNEAVSGNAAAVEAFLKSASSVTVSGSTIKVNGQPPSSIVTLLNSVAPGKVTWVKKDLTMSCTISVGTGKVTSISVDSLTGTCTAPLGKIKGQVSGKVTY